MGDYVVHVDFSYMEFLMSQMDDIADQAGEINAYVQDYVCRKDGFQTSSVCVLQPLGEAMDQISEAFTDAFQFFDDRWSQVKVEVAQSAADFDALDGNVTVTFNDLMNIFPTPTHRIPVE